MSALHGVPAWWHLGVVTQCRGHAAMACDLQGRRRLDVGRVRRLPDLLVVELVEVEAKQKVFQMRLVPSLDQLGGHWSQPGGREQGR